MAETADPKSSPPQPSEDLPWGMSYLREDIRNLRLEMHRENHGVREDVQTLQQEMRGIHGRIDETNRSLIGRIDETNQALIGRIDETNKRVDEMSRFLSQRMDSRVALLMATMIGLAGIIVGAMKI